MRAILLAVGTELLGTDRLDTNSLRITEVLRRYGVEPRRKAVLGDVEEVVAEEFRRAIAEAELVIATGGLGPTADDVTREAVAAALGLDLEEDPRIVAAIEQRFRGFGRVMPASNRKQALVPRGSATLPNDRGTAPGLRIEAPPTGRATIFLFPGVPFELEGLVERELVPWLERRAGGASVETATLRVAGLPESEVEDRIRPAYPEFGRESITVLASPGDILVRSTAAGPPEARRATLDRMMDRLAGLIGDAVYARREADTLEVVVGRHLAARGETVATAESCTGGGVGERLTRVAGSSAWFVGGVIAYDDRVKRELLGVPADVLAAHGAVSEPVARALAAGARRVLGAHWGIGITGIAGPGGGSEEKPVGTVHVAVAGPEGFERSRRVRFPGDRERVRHLAGVGALESLRRALLATAAGGRHGDG